MVWGQEPDVITERTPVGVLGSLIGKIEPTSNIMNAPTESNGSCTDPLMTDWSPNLKTVLVLVAFYVLLKIMK